MLTPRKRRRRKKPTKPYASFPLTSHNNGQWCKKIRGKMYFFGVWENPDAALQNYLRAAEALHAGRRPREESLSPNTLTVKDVCNHFLTYQLRRAETGEIGFRWAEDCRVVLENFARVVGTGRVVSDLRPDDFQDFRQRLLRKGLSGRKGLGVHALNRAITVVRGMLKHAYDTDLLDRPMKYGKAFDRPSASLRRKSRMAAQAENGKRLFTPQEIRKLLKAAESPLEAMILLGINGGFGNVDCARLTTAAVDWDLAVVRFDRPKTGVERVVPLWPETVTAMGLALDNRPQEADEAATGLFFLKEDGTPWAQDHIHRAQDGQLKKVVKGDCVGKRFETLLGQVGTRRKGVGFYALRHTFRTWADETRDQHAIHRIMGHAIPGMSGIYIEEISLERLRAVVDHVRIKMFPDEPVGDEAEEEVASNPT
ncbi:MAG: tyrosine-type recombinase/integrase [Phycisphaerae bacterium]|nr:tyrosine-type recombinase/integrase [Phycisphaerae bacterium]